MSTSAQPPPARSGLSTGTVISIVVGLVYAALATLILLCMAIDHLEQLRGEAARRAWGQFATLWLVAVPIPLVLLVGTRILWRVVAQAPGYLRQLTRATLLAFFLAPSFVGEGGPTGAFFLPGPACLMLLFGQWQFKFWLGLAPILVAWPIALVAYSVWERRRGGQKATTAQ
jgi:hypothetical protein